MGGNHSRSRSNTHDHVHHHAPQQSNRSAPSFKAIPDQYQTLGEVQEALRRAGLESSNLIIGVDYTKSNEWNGKSTFGGYNLHHLQPGMTNPYQDVIDLIGRTLEPFDDDKLIPVFGFGDVTTTDKSCFPFYPDRPSNGFREVLQRYNEITPGIVLSGPTNFAPLIREAIEIVKREKAFHILVIIADGQVSNVKDTTAAIVQASNYPISIIMIGVGDGPWELMEKFDDELPQRKFDNFQFVPFSSTMMRAENRDITFAVNALQEVPDQYREIVRLGLL
eukprot:TRINITY_DN14028_c0_g1_i1.p1 TRINITY_DN14028_c0_g1~~TRINITY_DN14028_c0_g1_i1.p1  ORF type:complete len:278 (+),score=99.87 TRINITY_DN14028_c0_g1_i1:204-1037(+)